MSLLTKFHTYRVMDNATVANATSESTGHPAEHAISPLEPNFVWETNEVDTYHKLTIDLGEVRACDGFSFIHHEVELESSPADETLDITVERSYDATNWIAVDIAYNTDGTDNPNDLFNESELIKLRYFTDGGTNLLSHSGRYWRFTLKLEFAGPSPGPSDYPPTNTRISMCWLFNLHKLDRGAAFPVDDTLEFPADSLSLPYGKTYRIGYSVNASSSFTRTWILTSAEYSILQDVLSHCNGVYYPFVYVDVDNIHRFCRFATDKVAEELLDTDLYRVTYRFVELPVVKKDKYH